MITQECKSMFGEIVARLLKGETVNYNSKSVNLAERLADQHQEFKDLADMGFDFMGGFQAGRLDKSLSEMIEREARTLASLVLE